MSDTPEAPLPEINEGPPLKDSWLKSYLEGNGLVPQKGMAIMLKTLNSVLQDPPPNFDYFRRSEFSRDQLDYIGRLMTNMHKAHGVDRRYGQEHERVGEDDRSVVLADQIQALWVATKVYSYMILLTYLDPSRRNSLREMDWDLQGVLNDRHTRDLDELFSNPQNKPKIEKLKGMVSSASEVLGSSRVKAIAGIYKMSLGGNTPIEEKFSQDPVLKSKAQRLGLSLRNVTESSLRKIRQAVTSNFKQKFPHEPKVWLEVALDA